MTTLGNTSGSNSYIQSAGTFAHYLQISVGSNDVIVDSITCKCVDTDSSGQAVYLCIHNSSGVLLYNNQITIPTSAATTTHAYSSKPFLTKNTNYYLSIQGYVGTGFRITIYYSDSTGGDKVGVTYPPPKNITGGGPYDDEYPLLYVSCTAGFKGNTNTYDDGTALTNGYVVNKVVLSSSINVLKMYFYASLNYAPGRVKGVIMDSSGNIITNGITNEYNPEENASRVWHELSFATNPSMSAGTYYLGIITNTNGWGSITYTTEGTTAGDGGNETDNSGYSSPTGMSPISLTNDTRIYSIYITHEVVSTGPGITIESKTPSTIEGISWGTIVSVR